MLPSRAAAHSLRALRARQPQLARSCGRRLASTSEPASSRATPSSNPAVVAALSGGGAGVLGAYLYGTYWYRSSGMKTLSDSAAQTKQYLQQAQDKLKEKAPEPDQALQWLRETALGYAGIVPFARPYVQSAFDDLDTVREKHGDRVDEIVRRAYEELSQVAKKGDVSVQTAREAWEIIEKYTAEISRLAVDAGQDILSKHPELKEKVGGNFEQLKQLGDRYGPEAKKMADETWDEVKNTLQSGSGTEQVNKIRQLVDEKTKQLKKFGDEAWQKGLEQAKPYLDKNPKVKELVQENEDALKQGNVGELFNKVKDAVSSGDTQNLEKYVKDAAGKAQESGFGGVDQILNKFPGGDQIVPKLTQLSEVAQKHGEDAERILKDTVNDIWQVLQKRGDEAKEIAKKAEQDAKH